MNGVLVGETTYRATREVIDYAEQEPVSAKGKSEPIPVWEALQAALAFGADLEQRHCSRSSGVRASWRRSSARSTARAPSARRSS